MLGFLTYMTLSLISWFVIIVGFMDLGWWILLIFTVALQFAKYIYFQLQEKFNLSLFTFNDPVAF